MPVNINYAKCNNCGACYRNCPTDVFEHDKELKLYRASFNYDCWHCGVCVLECDQKAVELTPPFAVL
jgi:NAD-dependent dihydropyrimidine dehydrogenase PreA subunit